MLENRFPLLLLAFFLFAAPLHAGTYLAGVQGTESSSMELGLLTRSFEQNLSSGFPTVQGNLDATLFDTPVVQANLLYRFNQVNPLVLGLGLSTRLSWQNTSTYALGLGLTAQASYEFVANHFIPFVQVTYMPWTITRGTSPSPLLKSQIDEYLRFGLRYVF